MPVLDYFLNVINNRQIRVPLRKILDEILDDLDLNKTAYDAHTHKHGAMVNMGLSKAGLAIDATPADVETTAAFIYAIDGVVYSYAAQAAIDISAVSGYTPTALITARQRIYLFSVDAAGALTITEGAAHATAAVIPDTPAGNVPFGYVKVVNASGSDFTFGTTSLAAAGITDTYVDLIYNPTGFGGEATTSAPGSDTGEADQGTASTFTQSVTHP